MARHRRLVVTRSAGSCDPGVAPLSRDRGVGEAYPAQTARFARRHRELRGCRVGV